MSGNIYETSTVIPPERKAPPISRETHVDVPAERIRSIITAATERLDRVLYDTKSDPEIRSIVLSFNDDVYLLRERMEVVNDEYKRYCSDFEIAAVEKRNGVDYPMAARALVNPDLAINLYAHGDDPVSLPLLFDTEPHQRHFLDALKNGVVIDQSRFFERYAPFEQRFPISTETAFKPAEIMYVLPRAA